jgi:hypothetical protein
MNRRCLIFLVIGLVSLSGCKSVFHSKPANASSPSTAAPKTPDLRGLWVMGNAASGTEASTIVRIEQNGQNLTGVLEQPAKDYAEQFGVKKGDLEFEGVLEGRTVRGKVHSYRALEVKEDCPKLSAVMLKDFELSLSEDENSLAGWTINNRTNVDKCEAYTKGRVSYSFQRLNKQSMQ